MNRVIANIYRGGCWRNDPAHCFAAYRGGFTPGNRSDGIGLRVYLRLDGDTSRGRE
jgi:formylglycine-generating enzyme required for sulfatase activity